MFLALFGLISSVDNSALGVLVGVLVHALILGLGVCLIEAVQLGSD